MYRLNSTIGAITQGFTFGRRRGALRPALRGFARRFLRAETAAISPMFALLLIPIAGSVAYAVELGGMHYTQRSMQNAADAAALAAASNNNQTGIGTTPVIEARAAAKPYGYVNGRNGVTVAAGVTNCPGGAAGPCYEAIITDTFPLSFSRVIGFLGTGNSGSQRIISRAVAKSAGGSVGSSTTACLWAFNHLETNGTPNADLTGCSVLSSGTMTCNGGNGVQADYAIAAGIVRGRCAKDYTNNNYSNSTVPADPYAALASNIPTTTCGSTPTPKSGNQSAILFVYCGDVTLTGNLTLNSPNTVIIIKDGTLDLNSKVLSTSNGASATIIFETNRPPFGDKKMKGTIDIKAPDSSSTSPWKGVAIYRKPGGPMVDATLAGSNATWKITGLVYFPNTDVTISGAVNHSATGATCFVLVGYNVTVNGNGQILQTTDGCNSAGLTAPPLVVGGGPIEREKLVL